jgi:xanthine phosphoribosyltransferase
MKLLEDKIRNEGKVFPGDILKVDNFLNHQMDVDFLCELGKEFHRLFADCGVNKILTIEASGIGIACLTAQFFHCPILFAKKTKSRNISSDLWVSTVHSYTHGTDHEVVVARQYLGKNDKVLIIDDFLANGSAITALVELCESAGAEVIGAAVAIEKAYQSGGAKLRAGGLRLEALARIARMGDDGSIEFCD